MKTNHNKTSNRKHLTREEKALSRNVVKHIAKRAKELGIPAEDFFGASVLIGIPGVVLKSKGQSEKIAQMVTRCTRESVHTGGKIGAMVAISFAFKKKWLTKEQAAKAMAEGWIAVNQI